MALLKIYCPDCNAGLRSPTGFTVGQTVSCPKCETYFTVEEPEDEEDEAPPPKKAPVKSKSAPAKKPVKAAAADDEDEDDDEEEEEEEEAPKKKKKKKKKRREDDEDDDEERSYKNSPLRFIVLGILVIIMLVLGYMLYAKKQDEKKSAGAIAVPGAVATVVTPGRFDPT